METKKSHITHSLLLALFGFEGMSTKALGPAQLTIIAGFDDGFARVAASEVRFPCIEYGAKKPMAWPAAAMICRCQPVALTSYKAGGHVTYTTHLSCCCGVVPIQDTHTD